MSRTYKGYTIEDEDGHYRVTTPDGESWTEDTIEDAHKAIDEKE